MLHYGLIAGLYFSTMTERAFRAREPELGIQMGMEAKFEMKNAKEDSKKGLYRPPSWKALYLFAFFFSFLLLGFFPISFQEFETLEAQEREETANRGTAQNILDIKDYNPFSKFDTRFRVSKPSFSRRFALDGSGEYLGVTFYIQNYTIENIDLYLFVSAYDERDLTDETHRKWVPHTAWRKRDFHKEFFTVNKVSISPKDIAPSMIWDVNDPDQSYYAGIFTLKENFVSTISPLPDFYPPIWKYLEYIRHNPKTGIPLQLRGLISPPKEKRIQSGNAQALLYERNGKKLMSKKPKAKYTIENSARLSIVHSYHFANFQREKSFFNRVAIQIFDAKESEKSGDRPKQALFKKIYSIKLPYRNN